MLETGYLYKDGLRPIAELDGAGALRSHFVYATRPNVPDLMVRGGVSYRLVADAIGSVRLVVSAADGSVAQRLRYDASGAVVEDTNPGFQPFGFAGGLTDRDTGLVHFGARDYDPEAGRWMTKDPIGFDGGDPNLYRYAGGDPINIIDPNGRWLPVVIVGVGLAYLAYRGLSATFDVGSRSSLNREFDPDASAEELEAQAEERARCDAAFRAGTEGLGVLASYGAPEETATGLVVGEAVGRATAEEPGFLQRIARWFSE